MVQVSSKEEVREHVTCSMCKNIFTSPQELACFHVFCDGCLKTLPRVESENKQGFHCPSCKTLCVLGEEKTPYMRNEFVKAFTSGEEKCGTCGKDCAVWHCQECDYIMCDDCKIHHSKMLLSKSHMVVSSEKAEGQRLMINKPIVCEVHADKFVKYYCTVCQELICSNCLTEKHIHKPNDVRNLVDAAKRFIPVIRKKMDLIEGKNKMHQDHVSSSESQMNEIREVFDGVRVELDQARQTVMQKINTQYQRDVKLLDECRGKEIEKLTEFKEHNEFSIAENKSLMSFAKFTLQSSTNGSLVKEITQGLEQRIDNDISNKKPLGDSKKIKLPRLVQNCSILSNGNILGKIQWEPVDDTKIIRMVNHMPEKKKIISCLTLAGILAVIIAVCLSHVLQTKPGAQRNSDFRHVNQNISEVLDRLSPAGTDIYTLPSSAHRMTLVNNTIWIPLTDSIAVITLNGTEVNMIYFPGYGDLYLRSVLQVNESVILLASNKGLYVVNSTGQIQYTVAEGHLKDISKHEDKVIALQWISDTETWLHRLKFDSSKWINEQGTIIIHNIPVGFGFVTMTVHDESVYISSWDYDKIYKYTLGGVLQQMYGGWGSSVGFLADPLLSAVDHLGTVLVCDRGNNRLQTVSAEGEWQEYRLGGGVRRPWDVIIVNKSLYVLWYDPGYQKHRISHYNIGD